MLTISYSFPDTSDYLSNFTPELFSTYTRWVVPRKVPHGGAPNLVISEYGLPLKKYEHELFSDLETSFQSGSVGSKKSSK